MITGPGNEVDSYVYYGQPIYAVAKSHEAEQSAQRALVEQQPTHTRGQNR